MIFTKSEQERRWSATRQLMQSEKLDAIVARGTAAADDGQGHYRWLTSEGPLAGDSLVALTSDDAALFSRGGPPAQWAEACSWFDSVVSAASINAGGLRDAGLPQAAAAWLKPRHVRRLGVADLSTFPHGAIETLRDQLPGVEFVEVGPAFLLLRNGKSAEELEVIRQSAAIADDVWAHVRDFVAVGRTEIEVLADIEHMLRLAGCVGSFDVVMHLNRGVEYDRIPSNRRLQQGDAVLLEVSPRLHGYFTQLVSVISLGAPTDELAHAFEASTTSRAVGAEHIQPGIDVQAVSRQVADCVSEFDVRLSGPVFGHMLGLELEEPRIGASSYPLVVGSTFVFHPVITTPSYPFVLRGDTFCVNENGAERLNRLPEHIIEI
ncbi:M24 family metallopeptidase [Subtercola sp. YIM 133946]|uniref:M24 family metallopeptidase n=1 Tax=Subtercola sp. YIM 133946 TaxID=3118909 RepID=UPI002F937A56